MVKEYHELKFSCFSYSSNIVTSAHRKNGALLLSCQENMANKWFIQCSLAVLLNNCMLRSGIEPEILAYTNCLADKTLWLGIH